MSVWLNRSTKAHDAAKQGDVKVLQAAVVQDATTLNQKDMIEATPLHYAVDASASSLECVQFLISHDEVKLDIADRKGYTPLIRAAMSVSDKSTEICQVLITASADVTMIDQQGMCPLHHAASKGQLRLLEELLRHPDAKEALTIKDKEGRTPHLVAEETTCNDKTALLALLR
mmetsp:Transcript_63141/g.104994  ORF Transcript_63141/g.104994 Transcript_63141/m.104994 type:complete len:173 (-) Transcript_63141:206-724(-)